MYECVCVLFNLYHFNKKLLSSIYGCGLERLLISVLCMLRKPNAYPTFIV